MLNKVMLKKYSSLDWKVYYRLAMDYGKIIESEKNPKILETMLFGSSLD